LLCVSLIMSLSWMMSKNNDNIGALFLLLLFILSVPVLKGIFSPPEFSKNPCNKKVFVEISGDVAHPGVYGFCRLPDLKDLFDRAGGLICQAEKDLPFKHIFIHSGTCVDVRSDGKESYVFNGEMLAFYRITLGIPLSINRETGDGLTAVPGISTRIANAIILERTKRGGFKRMNEILSIKGIGPALYKKLNYYLAI